MDLIKHLENRLAETKAVFANFNETRTLKISTKQAMNYIKVLKNFRTNRDPKKFEVKSFSPISQKTKNPWNKSEIEGLKAQKHNIQKEIDSLQVCGELKNKDLRNLRECEAQISDVGLVALEEKNSNNQTKKENFISDLINEIENIQFHNKTFKDQTKIKESKKEDFENNKINLKEINQSKFSSRYEYSNNSTKRLSIVYEASNEELEEN